MAEHSSFFNSENGDRVYTAADFANYFASFISNGVVSGGAFLRVSRTVGMSFRLSAGRAFINGYFYENRIVPFDMTLQPASATLPRIDRIVLRLDLRQEGRRIAAAVKTGIPAAAPVAPTLQRDSQIWELGLADIRVNAGTLEVLASNVTDLRLSPELCGIVTGVLDQPDFSEAFDRYLASYEEITGHMRTEWDGFSRSFDEFMKSSGATLAGLREEWSKFSDAYNGWFAQIKAELFTQKSTDFYDWSRRAGYDMVITFIDDGSIDERIVNRLNQSVLAFKTTVFHPDKSISESLTFNEPEIFVTKTTTFSGNVITESYT